MCELSRSHARLPPSKRPRIDELIISITRSPFGDYKRTLRDVRTLSLPCETIIVEETQNRRARHLHHTPSSWRQQADAKGRPYSLAFVRRTSFTSILVFYRVSTVARNFTGSIRCALADGRTQSLLSDKRTGTREKE